MPAPPCNKLALDPSSLVMDHLLRTIEAPEIFSELVRFGGGERCETILMVLRRIELSSMRRVSVSWRKLSESELCDVVPRRAS